MNSAFALVLTVFLVSGEPVDIADSVHRTMQECMTAATEQKIPGNCYPVDKIINIRFHSYMPAMAGICSSLNLS
ncbi:DUF1482 family protein [Escherichia coli]|uniref:DUF1482 family protein n=1 Tax=Escherichia coli TaxID=562 RepID=UPI0022E23FDE|nr:DUF1482 family protein [Escherichia coli]